MNTRLERILINTYKKDMISFLQSHPEFFKEAIELAVAEKQPYSWRSAWLLWSCMEVNDERIQPYIKNIIDALSEKKDGHQRELLKILSKMELDDELEGYLFDMCVGIWEQIDKKPSVRFVAFNFILKIVRKYPELSNEITFYVQDHYLETLSSGFRRAILNLVKEFL